jgi:hypothetical protein
LLPTLNLPGDPNHLLVGRRLKNLKQRALTLSEASPGSDLGDETSGPWVSATSISRPLFSFNLILGYLRKYSVLSVWLHDKSQYDVNAGTSKVYDIFSYFVSPGLRLGFRFGYQWIFATSHGGQVRDKEVPRRHVQQLQYRRLETPARVGMVGEVSMIIHVTLHRVPCSPFVQNSVILITVYISTKPVKIRVE